MGSNLSDLAVPEEIIAHRKPRKPWQNGDHFSLDSKRLPTFTSVDRCQDDFQTPVGLLSIKLFLLERVQHLYPRPRLARTPRTCCRELSNLQQPQPGHFYHNVHQKADQAHDRAEDPEVSSLNVSAAVVDGDVSASVSKSLGSPLCGALCLTFIPNAAPAMKKSL